MRDELAARNGPRVAAGGLADLPIAAGTAPAPSVKSGHADVGDVRDLRGVMDREGAQLSVLISLNEPPRPMRTEAATTGFYSSPWGHHPRIQLLAVAELLAGKKIDMPAGGAHMTQVALPPTPEPTVHPDQMSFGK